jgi:membrane-associated phospholipid phosphatase
MGVHNAGFTLRSRQQAVKRLNFAAPAWVACRMRARLLLVPLVLTFTLGAQDVRPTPHGVRWWQAAAVLGGIAVAGAFDEPVERDAQQDRSRFGDQLASAVRRMGEPEVFATVPAALIAAGLVTTRPGLRRGGERIAVSLALAGLLVWAGKLAVGRLRPNQTLETGVFKPFSGADAFPSGHATMAFALATSLADETKRPWATAALMTVAAGTGWSRLNDNKHWLSDVVAGAALGVTSAQLVEGRWTVFHLPAPALFVAPGRTGVEWRVRFRVR